MTFLDLIVLPTRVWQQRRHGRRTWRGLSTHLTPLASETCLPGLGTQVSCVQPGGTSPHRISRRSRRSETSSFPSKVPMTSETVLRGTGGRGSPRREQPRRQNTAIGSRGCGYVRGPISPRGACRVHCCKASMECSANVVSHGRIVSHQRGVEKALQPGLMSVLRGVKVDESLIIPDLGHDVGDNFCL